MKTWQLVNDIPSAFGPLQECGWFNLFDLVDRSVLIEHYTLGTTDRSAPRRTIAGRVIAITRAPDGDVALRFDGMPTYILAPSDVVRLGFRSTAEAPRMGLGRAW